MVKNKTYLFDFDGVLVDSTSYIAKGVIDYLDDNHVSYPDDIVKKIMPLGYWGTAKYFHDELGVAQDTNDIMGQLCHNVHYYYTHKVGLKEGVLEYLTGLKESNCSLNVLTASPHEVIDDCMRRLGIFDLFDHIWTCDEFRMKKSQVELFHKVADMLGVSANEITFFDDNIISLATAKKAGLYSIGVYDLAGVDFEQQMKETGNAYIYSFKDRPFA